MFQRCFVAVVMLASLGCSSQRASVLEEFHASIPEPCAVPTKVEASLRELGDDETIGILVRMKDQLFRRGGEYEAFCEKYRDVPRREMRARVLTDLKGASEASWAQVREVVEELESAQAIKSLTRFWIVNGFACEANKQAVEKIAQFPEVEYVYVQDVHGLPSFHSRKRKPPMIEDELKQANKRIAQEVVEREGVLFDRADVTIPWNLKAIEADQAWFEEGVSGEGVVVAIIDSGMVPTPSLTRSLWKNPNETFNNKDDDGNGLVDDVFGYDFARQTGYVLGDSSDSSHGSICAGMVAGRPLNSQKLVLGVAPRSRAMILKKGSLEAYEYALENGADIVSMSYMMIGIELGNLRGVFRLAHEHMSAAGLLSVGGAGNFATKSPVGKQIAVPKDIPCVIASAGIVREGEHAAPSSMGPCYWDNVLFYDDYPQDAPLIKPDVTAFFGGFYCLSKVPSKKMQKYFTIVSKEEGGAAIITGPRGNSFSGPCAGGVAALMLSTDPDLPVWELKRLMEESCIDIGDEGRDVKFGAGFMQARAAVRAVKERAGIELTTPYEKQTQYTPPAETD